MDTALQKYSRVNSLLHSKGFCMLMKSDTQTFNTDVVLCGNTLGSYGL